MCRCSRQFKGGLTTAGEEVCCCMRPVSDLKSRGTLVPKEDAPLVVERSEGL